MSDLYDEAQRLEEAEREAAIARQARRMVRGNWRTLSAKWCEGAGCGERIPDERRRAVTGVRLCVACQDRAERARRG